MPSHPCALITGGAGLLGFHTARHFLDKHWKVVVLDNLSRAGTDFNLAELQTHPNLQFVQGDVRRPEDVAKAFARAPKGRADLIVHLAAQVSVVESLKNPSHDFEVNVGGTFSLLETIRRFPMGKKPHLFVYVSTNKVYGSLAWAPAALDTTRYKFLNPRMAINENQQLDFQSPYACSKGAADQYVKGYGQSYGLPTVVLRNSCIYGPHQYGLEDQGWVSYFGIQAYLGRPITFYGDGKQVRDLLYVEDFARLVETLYNNAEVAKGKVYNVGGGKHQALSLVELLGLLETRLKKRITVRYAPWRLGDQKIYISDIGQLKNDFGWHPKVTVPTGLDRMLSWIETHRSRIEKIYDEGHKKPTSGALSKRPAGRAAGPRSAGGAKGR